MTIHVVLLSIPGLRLQDLKQMPQLRNLMAKGDCTALVPSFPAVTWPVQTNMLTGLLPAQHGIVANGFYWRDERRVEMWTASNDKILAPQLWDRLHQSDPQLTSAAWFPMLSKGSGADYICMPAPIHHPDGSESQWCYSRPIELYGELRDRLGHFPLQHFWGPLANLKSSAWIADSAIVAADRFRPRLFYVYLPHLDYAAQKLGPESSAAKQACQELDTIVGRLAAGLQKAYRGRRLIWLAASEYTIVPVRHAVFPNRCLRQAGMLATRPHANVEQLDLETSRAWALVDHQLAHVFVDRDGDVGAVADLFRRTEGIDEVLVGEQRGPYGLDHSRSGDVVLVSSADSWLAYYWWLEDAKAPGFARTVDIHRKPGYDPVELHWDPVTRTIPLDATLVRGSHGAPAVTQAQQGVLLSSHKGMLGERPRADTEVCEIVLRQFGIR